MPDSATLTREDVLEALKDVYDPEIPINVVDLGLIYDCQVNERDVNIKMTLTFPGCAMGPYIAQQARGRVEALDGVGDVDVELVFDPPWSPDLITEEGRAQLGM